MLVNPGGPGVPGTELIPAATSIWPQDIRDRFDIVAWDPRGTGGSAPVDCVADVDRYFAEPDPSPDTPAEKQELVDRAQEFDDACEKADGPMLAHISTVDTANDLERIRQALGEDTITYFGFSYGSELGATYATLFGKHIRAMVLDGAIDPDLDGVETAHAQAVGAEHALDSFLADCSSHRTCAFNNNGNAEGAFDTLMAKLDSNPLPPPEKGRPEVGQGVALNAVIQALYSQDLWPSLAEALNDAQHGNGDGLLALSDSYLERDDNGTWSNTIEAFIAISCLDDPVPTRPQRLRRARRAVREGRTSPRSLVRLRLPVRAVAGAASTRAARRPAPALPRSSSSARPATRSLPSRRASSSRTRSRAACCSCARARATPPTARTSASTTPSTRTSSTSPSPPTAPAAEPLVRR